MASIVDLSLFRLCSSSSAYYFWHSYLGHVFASRLQFLASIVKTLASALGNASSNR